MAEPASRVQRVMSAVTLAVLGGTLLAGAVWSVQSAETRKAVAAPLLHARDQTALALGADAVGDVYITPARMLRRRTAYDPDTLAAADQAICAFAAKRTEPVFLLLAPTAAAVYPDALPANAPLADENALLLQASAALKGDVTWIETASWLTALREEALYFRTDPHWTTFGAYTAYKPAARKLGFSPIGYDRLIITHFDSEYYGAFAEEADYRKYPPDLIDLYDYDSPGAALQITALRENGTEQLASYWQPERAGQTGNPYDVFAFCTEPVLYLESARPTGKNLLVLADSYAAPVLPLIAQHYRAVTAVNLELTAEQTLEQLTARNTAEYSQILLLCSTEFYASGRLTAALKKN